jgi:hypothetical protein
VEHRQVEDRPAGSYRGSGDDPARFLRELRQLRDGAGLGAAELAARAHYPYDRIKAAEVGPTLPDLPVLSAYVRGCGGTTEEWEERWRSLTSAPTLPLVDARPAGCSTAASAGARIGSVSPVSDTPDPSIILAALDRVAEQMSVGTPAALPSRSGGSTIEQLPGISTPSPAAAAAAKSAGGKAGTGRVTAWETTEMRTAWSPAAGSTAREASQLAAADGPAAAPTGATAASADGVGAVAARPGTADYSAATLGKPESGGSVGGIGSGGPDGAGESAAAKPFAPSPSPSPSPGAGAGVGAGSTITAAAGPITVGRRSGALSRTTVAALIAIAVCVLVALLAIFA